MFLLSTSHRRMKFVGYVTLCVAMALATAPEFAQPDPKVEFTDALGRFSLALDGEYGDEGTRIKSRLDAMSRALAQWDRTIRSYETGMAAEITGAAPPLAARMHLALGGAYLDRGRVDDAVRELTAADRLDATRPDILTLLGLAYSQRPNDSSRATDAFRRASALDPRDPVRAYRLARHLVTVGETEEAGKVLARFRDNRAAQAEANGTTNSSPFISLGLVPESVGVEPFFAPALYAEGFSLLQQGNYEQALTAFRNAASHDPLCAEPGVETGALLRAATAFRDGSLKTAAQHLKVALELTPESADAHRMLGTVYVADELYDEGIAELEAAVHLRPSDERARLALAAAFSTIGQNAEAVRTLRETIAALPASGQARYELGLAYRRQGLVAEALDAFQDALTFKPLIGVNSVLETLGSLRRSQQDFDGAIAAFAARVALVPNDADAHQDLGDMFLRQERHNEALAEFEVALMLAPGRAQSHAAIAQVHLREGRYAEAADAARRTLVLDPAHKEARYVLATTLMRLGKTDEGKRELETFQRLQAEAMADRSRRLEVSGLSRDAAVSSANGDFPKAIELLRKAVLAQPDSAGLQTDLGVALIKAGQPAEAVEHFKQAVTLKAHVDVHAYLAEAYASLGRDEDAQRERSLHAQLRQEALRKKGAER